MDQYLYGKVLLYNLSMNDWFDNVRIKTIFDNDKNNKVFFMNCNIIFILKR